LRNLQILSKEEGKIDYPKSLRLTVPDVSALSPVVQEFLTPKRPYVVLVPGSVWKTKRWFSDGYREVAEHFLNTGMRVLVLGSPQEIEVCGEVSKNLSVDDLSGKTSLQEVVRLIHDAELAVCNDSFAQHVASAVQTRNVVVFCATSPEFGFGPWQNAATVVEKSGLSCKPCRRHGSQQCPTGTESCMKDLPSVQVIEAAQQLLEHSSTSGGRSGFKGH
jgi:heptosyltransferase-2